MNEFETIVTTEEESVDIRRIAMDVIKYWWVIAISTALFGALGLMYCFFFKTPLYVSETGIYVMSNDKNGNISYSDTQLATQLTKDYAHLIVSRTVLEAVAEECDFPITYEDLKEKISVSNVKDTRIIEISVKDDDPKRAQFLADHIRVAAAKQIKAVTGVQMVTTVDEASLPTVPYEPSAKKWLINSLLVGFVLSFGILLVRSILDDTLKTAEDVDRELGWSTLALIPMIELEDRSDTKKHKQKVPVKNKPQAVVKKKA